MHRALQIPELVELTFSKLVGCPVSTLWDDRQTLARVARTSRFWTELALARLWSEMRNLAPLFLILGPMKISQKLADIDYEEPLYADEYEFIRPTIPPKAWTRFDHYARYIRVVCLSLELDHGYSPALYEVLAKHRPNTLPLLPNLRTLQFCDSTDMNAGLDPLITILSSSIRAIVLELDHGEYFRPALIDHISPRTPSLQSLTLLTEATSGQELEAWIKNLDQLKHLQINSRPLTSSFWGFLSRFAPLESLLVYGVGRDNLFQHIPAFAPEGFSNLRSLTIQATMRAWRELLQGGNIPPLLQDVEVDLEDEHIPVSTDDFVMFSKAVSSAIPGLQSFHLGLGWKITGGRAITFDDIRPLLSCGSMRNFTIENALGVNLSPPDMTIMLQSWPKLRFLDIAYHTDLGVCAAKPQLALERKIVGRDWPKRELSLDVLNTFAELCPDIEELSISLDDAPPEVPMLDHDPVLHKLRVLDIAMSPIRDPELTALYLSRIAPQGVALRWDGWRLEDHERREGGIWAADLGRWEEVEVLARIHRLRRAERRQRDEPGWRHVEHGTKA